VEVYQIRDTQDYRPAATPARQEINSHRSDHRQRRQELHNRQRQLTLMTESLGLSTVWGCDNVTLTAGSESAKNYNKQHNIFIFLNCNQHFVNFKP